VLQLFYRVFAKLCNCLILRKMASVPKMPPSSARVYNAWHGNGCVGLLFLSR
jgi:hypothetical protein